MAVYLTTITGARRRAFCGPCAAQRRVPVAAGSHTSSGKQARRSCKWCWAAQTCRVSASSARAPPGASSSQFSTESRGSGAHAGPAAAPTRPGASTKMDSIAAAASRIARHVAGASSADDHSAASSCASRTAGAIACHTGDRACCLPRRRPVSLDQPRHNRHPRPACASAGVAPPATRSGRAAATERAA